MKILLVYPCLNTIPGYQTGLGYIAALLREKGHDARLFNVFLKSDIVALINESVKFNPGVIAFSSVSTQFKWVAAMAGLLRLRLRTKPLLICGGVHPTLEPGCLSKCTSLDGVVRGEGEYAMMELAERLEKKSGYLDIRSFHFRQGRKIIKNGLRPQIKDLDVLPFPYRRSINYKNIAYSSFIFSRGCPFSCSFCCNHALNRLYNNNRVRFRSPEKAVEEIERATKNQRYLKSIRLDDDCISLNKEWLVKFLGLYRRHLPYAFSCNVAIQTARPDIFRLLKKSGCQEVRMGIESGDQRLRRTILRKPLTDAQIIKAFTYAHEAGLKTFSFNLIGFPCETARSFQKTIRLNRLLKVDRPTLAIFHPYPGTALMKKCIDEKIVGRETVCGTFEFTEREDSVLAMPGFKRKIIVSYFKKFNRLVHRGTHRKKRN